MKKLLISMFIISCLITVIACSKEKKGSDYSLNNNSVESVSISNNSKNNQVVETKYRGKFICVNEASFQITEKQLIAHVHDEGSSADGMHLGLEFVFTNENELWAVDYSGNKLAGRFIDVNTLIPTENIFLGNYNGKEFRRQ